MPLSFRLSDEADEYLDRLVKEGRCKSKAEAIRRALNLYINAEEARKQGKEVVAISPRLLRDLDVVERFQ